MDFTYTQVRFLLIAAAALTGILLPCCFFYFICLHLLCREHSSGVITEVKGLKSVGPVPGAQRLRVRFDTESGDFEGLETLAAMPDHFYVGERVHVRYCRKKPGIFMVVENRRMRVILVAFSLLLAATLVLLPLVNAMH